MRNRGDVLTGSFKLKLTVQHLNMYGSVISVSLSFRIGNQIMGINMGLDVANELVLNMFTPQ